MPQLGEVLVEAAARGGGEPGTEGAVLRRQQQDNRDVVGATQRQEPARRGLGARSEPPVLQDRPIVIEEQVKVSLPGLRDVFFQMIGPAHETCVASQRPEADWLAPLGVNQAREEVGCDFGAVATTGIAVT